MSTLMCPRCVTLLDKETPGKCPNPGCQHVVTSDYLASCKESPPTWIVSVGYPSHGKTTFLHAWTLTLENLGRRFAGAFSDPLDPDTFEGIRLIRAQVEGRELPSSTNEQKTYVLTAQKLPGIGTRTLVVHDVRGELFHQMDSAQVVAALREVKVVWMLVSLRDLESNAEGFTMQGLFRSYQAATSLLHSPIQGRTVVVVYTKADRYEFNDSTISDYLAADPLQDVTNPDAAVELDPKFNLARYVDELESISLRLRDFTLKRVRGGSAFIHAAEGRGFKLKFCITSATGHDANRSTQTLNQRATPYRVLDPLFLALTLDRELVDKEHKTDRIALVLDSAAGAEAVYGGGLHQRVWESLKAHGRVATYYLGIAKPVGQPGQQPPSGPDRVARHRLIGPILEREPAGSRVLILTSGPIRDLNDFNFGEWRKRVLLVTTYEDHENAWPLKYSYRAGDTPETIVRQLVSPDE